MEKTLFELRKKAVRRTNILSMCTITIFLSLIAFFILSFFNFSFTIPNYVRLAFIVLAIIAVGVGKYETKEIKKEIGILVKRTEEMLDGIEDLIGKLSAKREEFEALDESSMNKDEYQMELIKYSEFVFVDILNRLVDVTGVYPDEPVFLRISTKGDIDELFSAAHLTLVSVQGAIAALHERLIKNPIYQ